MLEVLHQAKGGALAPPTAKWDQGRHRRATLITGRLRRIGPIVHEASIRHLRLMRAWCGTVTEPWTCFHGSERRALGRRTFLRLRSHRTATLRHSMNSEATPKHTAGREELLLKFSPSRPSIAWPSGEIGFVPPSTMTTPTAGTHLCPQHIGVLLGCFFGGDPCCWMKTVNVVNHIEKQICLSSA